MNLIDKAKAFAKERHAGQTRKYSGEPYSQHLRSVVQLLDGYRVTPSKTRTRPCRTSSMLSGRKLPS
jgi:(p)ppGpp synthase/HD superfamily hydrolase